jgi:hypothetical protein
VRPDLPTGTVTFVFTDAEGLTSLLDELGTEGYAAALADHRTVIRQACIQDGRRLGGHPGRRVLLRFPTTPVALHAAAEFTDHLDANGQIRV